MLSTRSRNHQDLLRLHPNLGHGAEEANDPFPDCCSAEVVNACGIVEDGAGVVVGEVGTGVVCAVDFGCAVFEETERGVGACVGIVDLVVFEVGVFCH